MEPNNLTLLWFSVKNKDVGDSTQLLTKKCLNLLQLLLFPSKAQGLYFVFLMFALPELNHFLCDSHLTLLRCDLIWGNHILIDSKHELTRT